MSELISWAEFIESAPDCAFKHELWTTKCRVCGREFYGIYPDQSEENRVCKDCGPKYFLEE